MEESIILLSPFPDTRAETALEKKRLNAKQQDGRYPQYSLFTSLQTAACV